MTGTVYPPPPEFAARARIGSLEAYREAYERSIADPEGFWAAEAEDFHWERRWDRVRRFDPEAPGWDVGFFVGGRTNVAFNALDRDLETRGERIALVWEGARRGEARSMTYRELRSRVCRLAGALAEMGVARGDRVLVHLPRVPELVVAMLACARLGAVHAVVGAGIGAPALAERIADAGARVVITAGRAVRGGRDVAMKERADRAIVLAGERGTEVSSVIVVRRPGPDQDVPRTEGRDRWYDEVLAGAPAEREPEWVDAEDPLYLMYVRGPGGGPLGLVHATGGTMVQVASTIRDVLDVGEGDVLWTTADPADAVGQVYSVYGPLLVGAATVLLEEDATFEDGRRGWGAIERLGVTSVLFDSLDVRALADLGSGPLEGHDLSSLRVVAVHGEPLDAGESEWLHDAVGRERCPVVEAWMQPETGAFLFANLPGAVGHQPGSVGLPLPGVRPVVVDGGGQAIDGDIARGNLCFAEPWPSIARGAHGWPQHLERTHLAIYRGLYFADEGCLRDADGTYWPLDRVDERLEIGGRRLPAAEVEGVLASHAAVVEAAVVGRDRRAIDAFLVEAARTPPADFRYPSDGTPQRGDRADVERELARDLEERLGAAAVPETFHWIPALPRTAFGRVKRSVLRSIATGLPGAEGLAEDSAVRQLLESET